MTDSKDAGLLTDTAIHHPAAPQRLMSLDVFRGATLAAMLIANNAGDWKNKFPAFGHAAWDGLTFTDLIFPGFVFIMGVAMTFSFSRRLAEGADRKALLFQIIRRTLILFALGVGLQAISYALLHNPESERQFRYLGVLHRLALCYGITGLLLLTGIRARGQAIIAALLLTGYFILMKYVPVPGFGAGKLGIEGGNWSSWLDDKILGPHAYMKLKPSGQWHDPEGLLSTLPAVATTLIGTITGYLFRDKTKSPYEKVSIMMAWGFGILVLGMLWGYVFPINKNLWTSSFVLAAGGWSLLGLGACYYVCDIRRANWWTLPFVILGTNAIFAYCTVALFTYLTLYFKVTGPDGKEMALKTWLYDNLVKSWMEPAFGPNMASLGWGIFYIALWTLLIGVLLYRKRIFIRV